MPNQKADDRERMSYLEDTEVVAALESLSERSHVSVATLIREATYQVIIAHEAKKAVELTSRKPRKTHRGRAKKNPT